MPYTPFTVDQFGGLNLIADPQELGAGGSVDLLNVDFDKQGRVRTRDGYANLTSDGDAHTAVAPYYKTDGTRQVLAASGSGPFGFISAYSTAGALVDSQPFVIPLVEADFTRFGGPGAEVSYFSAWNAVAASTAAVYKWNGALWATATGVRLGGAGNYPWMLEVKATDNRLVGAFLESNSSRIGFSGAGTPETWGANDYVDLTPGDGERVTSLVAWREMVFAFKETKFFVFGNTAIDGTGQPVFNYRPVAAGVGSVAKQCACASPHGVYFLSRRGIYKTTGGDPTLISRDIDPIFRGGASSFYLGGILNPAAIDKCQLAWHDERLYFAYPSGSATENDRMVVFDPETNLWLLWDVPAAAMTSFRVGNSEELVFSASSGDFNISRLAPAYTTDDGVAISSRIQSGFYDLGDPGTTAYTRWTRVWGSGAPTVSVFTDFSSTDTQAASVTLGTSPALAEGYHQRSYQGQTFSHKLSASSAFNVNRLQHDIAHVRA